MTALRARLATCGLALLTLGLSACGTGDMWARGGSRVKAGIGGAVTAPFEDLNIKRTEIPPVLIRAQANPYDVNGMTRCEPIAAEVGALDDALGPDMDEPPPPEKSRREATADGAADTTLEVVRGASTDVIPFRGWVRKLSGAERHNKQVQAAIRAGTARRAYLKALGMSMNCAPPAAPRWFVPVEKVAPAPPPPARKPPVKKKRPRPPVEKGGRTR